MAKSRWPDHDGSIRRISHERPPPRVGGARAARQRRLHLPDLRHEEGRRALPRVPLELSTMRWSRLSRRAGIGIAAGIAAFAATAVLALTRNGSAGSAALP